MEGRLRRRIEALDDFVGVNDYVSRLPAATTPIKERIALAGGDMAEAN